MLESIKSMISPDDILAEEDISDINQARTEFDRGKFTRHDAINWE